MSSTAIILVSTFDGTSRLFPPEVDLLTKERPWIRR